MAGIGNIVGAYNINPKRVSSKLSFELGQIFAAKIVSTGDLNKELILKLLDGWQFPAMLESALDFIPEGLVKFQVDGFKDGKLQIRIVNDKKDEDNNNDSIEELVLSNNIDVDKEDFDMLKQMVKHNMPLTKENISKIKTIVDFKEKIFNDIDEEEKFIAKYALNKGIDLSTDKGKNIERILKNFFKEFKGLSEDEMFTMLENDIELTSENIRSFKKIVNESSFIYKEAKSIEKDLENIDNYKLNNSRSDLENTEVYDEHNSIKQEGTLNIKDSLAKIDSKVKSESEARTILQLIEGELMKENVSEEDVKLYKAIKEHMEKKLEDFGAANIDYIDSEDIDFKEIEKIFTSKPNIEQDGNTDKIIKDTIKLDKNEMEVVVKQQLASKTEEIKAILKELINKEASAEPEVYDKVFQIIKENINDFKVFNSISNQYYYMDVPINMNKSEYDCKLIIKDDRKSGKKIDSKNVSLVISVKTVNIGVVDAYIKVKDKNMNVDIKCNENWIKKLSHGKDIITNELKNLGYNVFVNVDKKEEEVRLTNCGGFFEDTDLGTVNARV